MRLLEIVTVLLVVFWILGMVSAQTMGGFIHILLVVAVVTVLIRVIRGRKVIDE